MSKYLELVEGSFTQEHLDKQKNQKPYVAYSIIDNKVIYNVILKESIPAGSYIIFTAQEDNSSIGLSKLSPWQTMEYSTDTINWNTFDTTTSVNLNKGDQVCVRGILESSNTNSKYTQFKMSGKIAATGNCNALWNYEDLNAPLKEYCGSRLFFNCSSLTTAPELPATILAKNCYSNMFWKCASLTVVPELPATTLAEHCYGGMFSDCTSLNIVPELPATTLAESCYQWMFSGCTSLTTAPELPATELAEACYWGMFTGCDSLTTAPELPTTTLDNHCYDEMFYNCTSLTVAPELPATTLTEWCYHRMFAGCSSLTTAPELPVLTTLADYCYNEMFYNCTSLTVAPELRAATSKELAYTKMFYGCSKLSYIKCLDTDSLYRYQWTAGVSPTGTFVKSGFATNWTTGIDGIPSGWTVENVVL